MTVSTDVRNPDGMLLIPAGAQLSPRHLSILESWGVAEIEVTIPEGMENVADPLLRLAPDELGRMTGAMRRRFPGPVEGDEVAAEVFRLMLRREAARRLARDAAGP